MMRKFLDLALTICVSVPMICIGYLAVYVVHGFAAGMHMHGLLNPSDKKENTP